jgi:hypothetical protein
MVSGMEMCIGSSSKEVPGSAAEGAEHSSGSKIRDGVNEAVKATAGLGSPPECQHSKWFCKLFLNSFSVLQPMQHRVVGRLHKQTRVLKKPF